MIQDLKSDIVPCMVIFGADISKSHNQKFFHRIFFFPGFFLAQNSSEESQHRFYFGKNKKSIPNPDVNREGMLLNLVKKELLFFSFFFRFASWNISCCNFFFRFKVCNQVT